MVTENRLRIQNAKDEKIKEERDIKLKLFKVHR